MDQTQGMTGAAADVVELLTSDHRVVEQLFRQFEAARADSAVARDLAEEIIRELSVHAAVEEQLLYPALRNLPEGEELANHGIEEHQQITERLAAVDGKDVEDPEVRKGFETVRTTLEHHVAEEEGRMFPALRAHVDQERLMEMGRAIEIAKKAAPTRPHPGAPRTPPGNLVAGVAAGAMDRVRDAVRGAMRSVEDGD